MTSSSSMAMVMLLWPCSFATTFHPLGTWHLKVRPLFGKIGLVANINKTGAGIISWRLAEWENSHTLVWPALTRRSMQLTLVFGTFCFALFRPELKFCALHELLWKQDSGRLLLVGKLRQIQQSFTTSPYHLAPLLKLPFLESSLGCLLQAYFSMGCHLLTCYSHNNVFQCIYCGHESWNCRFLPWLLMLLAQFLHPLPAPTQFRVLKILHSNFVLIRMNQHANHVKPGR